MPDLAVLDMLKVACKAGDSLKQDGMLNDLERLLESGKAMMRAEGVRFIDEAGHLPLLVSYSSDATPLKKVAVRRGVHTAAGQPETRQGRQHFEVLVENIFMRYFDASGVCRSAAVLRDPVPLTNGKSGDATWACARDQMLLPRDHGHVGIVVSHYAFDGGLYSFL
eukprot:2594497-Lingulodinium_polyedra.AAC.1